ncbi:sulfotransferase [Streptomyces sp. cg36]|uniref:sulfotransferase family protein n=1 Tax=Streptomyces sp. cg36 TaxID=3238798 RepID=UPI0034E2F899
MRQHKGGYAVHLDLEDLVRPADMCASVGGRGMPFRRALERFVESLNSDARLTPDGVSVARSRIRASFAVQERMAALRAPASAALDSPVFVTGMPGSGAALLHNLLAEHPGVDAPTLWELQDPAAAAAGPDERRALIARGRARTAADQRVTAGRAAGRFREATRPGACHWLLANAFHSPALALTHRVPGYADWLEEQDLAPAYAFHRRQLQAVVHRVGGGALVLRDPFHAPHLRDLLRVYPHAKVIRVHRDPADLLAVTAGISSAQRAARSFAQNPADVGPEWAGRFERQLAAAEEARTGIAEGALLDLRHRDLVEDTAATLRRVAEFVGVPVVPSVEGRMLELARSAAVAARGARHFEPEEFGLSRRQLGFRFAHYRSAFGV